ncbi:MAG: hypothetical protein AWM53_01284 [Candidatus Dichloromethanomonas elyunquensis]|nr:MAG: hypothetical protein AWM53_01284 [Candidatus Dichloromethanomonas elyunquensis]
MAKSKMEKTVKNAKNDINKFVDEAKESTRDAINYIKNKTK